MSHRPPTVVSTQFFIVEVLDLQKNCKDDTPLTQFSLKLTAYGAGVCLSNEENSLSTAELTELPGSGPPSPLVWFTAQTTSQMPLLLNVSALLGPDAADSGPLCRMVAAVAGAGAACGRHGHSGSYLSGLTSHLPAAALAPYRSPASRWISNPLALRFEPTI